MRRKTWLVVALVALCFFCWLEEWYRGFFHPFFDAREQNVPLIDMGGMPG